MGHWLGSNPFASDPSTQAAPLGEEELRVRSTAGEQALVRSLLHDPAIAQEHDSVGVENCVHVVSHHDRCAPGGEGLDRLEHVALRSLTTVS